MGTESSSASSVDRKSTRLNSSHSQISYADFCLKKKTKHPPPRPEAWQAGPRAGWGRATKGCLVLRAPRPARTPQHVVVVTLFFNDTATTEISTLSLHDALPIFL